MAKDNRAKTRKTTSRSRSNKGNRALLITIAITCVLAVVFGIVLFNALSNDSKRKENDSTVNQHSTTPIALQKKVAYYIVGLLGEEETSPTTSLFLLCHDKKENTINVLEVPGSTYLGDSDLWIEKKAGNVWGNPAPLDWCDHCGKRLYKAEVAEHEEMGHPLSQKAGSASYGLISIFNEQYALPIDGYFMIPREAFVKLVDLLGGLDVDLPSAMTLNEIKFGAGIKTLDGAAALQYITSGGDTVKAELSRLTRQRQVFIALFQRLCAQSEEQLRTDSIIPVMKGSTPLRTRTSQNDMVNILLSFKKVPVSQVTVMTLPGTAATKSGVSYYSVYRQQLIEVLNTYFNPYGAAITEADVQITEVVTGGTADLNLKTMDQVAVEQKLPTPVPED